MDNILSKLTSRSLPIILTLVSISAIGQPVTWSEHIAPIFYANCVKCHNDQGPAPFELLTYNSASGWDSAISDVVSTGEMPLWMPDRTYSTFLDERFLTQSEIDLIVQWVTEGSVEGDTSLAPPLPVINTGPQLGPPDLALTMGQYQVTDTVDDFRVFVLPTGLLNDTVISGIEFISNNKAAIHHSNFFQDTTGAAQALDSASSGEGYPSFGGIGFPPVSFIDGWVPGYLPRLFPDGFGARLYKEADIVLQIHFAPGNQGLVEQATLNTHFTSSPNLREVEFMAVGTQFLINGPLFIPADSIRSFEEVLLIDSNISILSIAPHMHLLGKEMRVFATTPTNDTIQMCWIPDWDFHWQGWLRFPYLLKIPAGSEIHVQSTYDNTVANLENPNNPPLDVSEGSNTTDEMMICYVFKVPYQIGDENLWLGGDTTTVLDTTDTTGTTSIAFSAIQKSGFECYPNPTKDIVFVKMTLLHNLNNATIQLYDVRGKLVKKQEYNRLMRGTNLLPFELGDCKPGTYVMVLVDQGGEKILSQKLIID